MITLPDILDSNEGYKIQVIRKKNPPANTYVVQKDDYEEGPIIRIFCSEKDFLYFKEKVKMNTIKVDIIDEKERKN